MHVQCVYRMRKPSITFCSIAKPCIGLVSLLWAPSTIHTNPFWILENESRVKRRKDDVEPFLLGSFVVHLKERNKRCFEGLSTTDNQLGEKIKHMVGIWASSLTLFKGISANSIFQNWMEIAFSHPHKPCIVYRWVAPPNGALKLDFDGSSQGNSGMAGIGEVIR